MAFSGSVFSKLFDWDQDPQRQEKIRNSRLEAEFEGIATGLSQLADGTAGGVADNAVTDAKLRDSGPCSVIGRSANSSGDPADISAASNGDVLRRTADVLGFGSIPSTSVSGLGLLATQDTDTLFKILDADEAGQDVNTAQPWFPTAGAVTLAANTTYEFWGRLRITRAAGTTAHTTSVLFAGTATLTNIDYTAWSNSADDLVAADTADINATSAATATEVFDSSVSATEDKVAQVHGIVRINGAGTFIPQFQYSVAPGGAPTIQQNSYFMLRRLGAGNVTTQGTWS